MIQATVVSLTKTDAVVNIGLKSDGLISTERIPRCSGGVKVGDVIEVMVKKKKKKRRPWG